MDTTATTLRWGLLFMAHHQDIQQRVRSEIHERIGTTRAPNVADRSLLHYTEAVLCEIHRFGSIGPLGLPHRTLNDVKLQGFDIPKHSVVNANLYAIHRDPQLWPDPEHFNPDANFIREAREGEGATSAVELKNTEYLVPFGMGRRQCLGEALARQELLIFFVGLLQRFMVKPSASHPLPPEDTPGVVGTIRAPPEFHICFE